MSQEDHDSAELLITLTADIVAAHVSNNSVAVSDVPTLIGNVHSALAGLSGGSSAPAVALEPAVPIRLSVKKDYIVCLDDGKKLKMLKRHLMTHYGMTPDDYRAFPPIIRWSRRLMPSSVGFWPRPLALGAHRDRAARKKWSSKACDFKREGRERSSGLFL